MKSKYLYAKEENDNYRLLNDNEFNTYNILVQMYYRSIIKKQYEELENNKDSVPSLVYHSRRSRLLKKLITYKRKIKEEIIDEKEELGIINIHKLYVNNMYITLYLGEQIRMAKVMSILSYKTLNIKIEDDDLNINMDIDTKNIRSLICKKI